MIGLEMIGLETIGLNRVRNDWVRNDSELKMIVHHFFCIGTFRKYFIQLL